MREGYIIRVLSGVMPASYRMRISKENPMLEWYLNTPSKFKVLREI